MDSCFHPYGQKIISGGGGPGNKVLLFDIQQQKSIAIGGHEKAVRTVNFLSEKGLIVTGGWDGKVNFFDARAYGAVAVLDLQSKIFAADTNKHVALVATADRKVHELDTRGAGTHKSDKTSLLPDSQTRCIAWLAGPSHKPVFVVGGDIGSGSIQGSQPILRDSKWHVAPTTTNNLGVQERMAYAINAIAPHNNPGIFATAGSDGLLKIWDGSAKTLKKRLGPINRPITAAKFNVSGELLAYASGYDWSKGATYNFPGNDIFIHSVEPASVKPIVQKPPPKKRR